MNNLTTFEVGKPFPVSMPEKEGAVMELWERDLNVFIQMPALKGGELKAFETGFSRYTYLESDTPIPVAIWVFDFPLPHGPIGCDFNARGVKEDYIHIYLDRGKGGVNNTVTFFLLDGQILKATKKVGLHWGAVDLFHATIKKQMDTEYGQKDYEQSRGPLVKLSPEELLYMGKIFQY